MNERSSEGDLEARAQFFKALGHPTRLLILNLVKAKPRHGEELAAILRLKPATISHHLTLLTGAGLLTARKDQYYQVYSLVAGPLERKLSEMIHTTQPDMKNQVDEDAYRAKVLRSFFKRGRLVQIPGQLKKRQIVLERLAEEFEPDREYTEREVNLILLDFHDDVASLRRGMVEQKLMEREKGIYRRITE